MTNAYAPTQIHYRFQEEDGSESAATLLGSEDTPLTRTVITDSNIQLRIGVNETGAGAIAGTTNATFQLQRSINGGAFANVTTTSTAVKVNTASALTDGGTTSARLTAPATFTAGQQDDQNGAVTFTHPANNFTEHVFGLTIVAAETAQGDALTFRLLYQGNAFSTITNGGYDATSGVPTLNVSEAVSFTANTTTGIAAFGGQTPSLTIGQTISPTIAVATFVGQAATLAAGATVTPSASIATFAGLAPTVSAGGGLVQRLSPNEIVSSTNLKDTLSNIPPTRLADIDDETAGSPGPDTEWWTAVNPNADIDVLLGFPTAPGNLVGTQTIRVLIRGTSLPSRNWRLDLYENGSPAPGSPTIFASGTTSSVTGQVVSFTFQPGDIVGATGAGVQVRIRGTA